MTTATRATATPTVSERLADHVWGLHFDDIPPTVIDKTKALLAHHLDAAIRGHDTESGHQAVRIALELSGGGGGCSIAGERQPADLLEAIFANSFLMSAAPVPLDVLMPQGVNPGGITHPVAWAVGEANRVSGRELLVAVIAGYDVASRVADPAWGWGPDVVDRPARYRPKHILAPFAAAATAARLLDLSREQVVHALSHAGQTGMGIIEGPPQQPVTLHPLLARNGTMRGTEVGADHFGAHIVLAPRSCITNSPRHYRDCHRSVDLRSAVVSAPSLVEVHGLIRYRVTGRA